MLGLGFFCSCGGVVLVMFWSFFVSSGFLKLLVDLFTISAIENFLLAGKNRPHTYTAVCWIQRCLADTLEGL